MKKLIFFIISFIILFTAHKTYAVNEKASNKRIDNPSFEKRNDKTPTLIQADTTQAAQNNPEKCSENVANHGKYVSCIAKTHPGGKIVSQAAQTSIGKAKTNIPNEPSPTTTVTPTLTIIPTQIISPTITPPPPPTTEEDKVLGHQVRGLVEELRELIKTLKEALKLSQ